MTNIQRLVLQGLADGYRLRCHSLHGGYGYYDNSAYWTDGRPAGFEDRRYVRGPTASSLLTRGWITSTNDDRPFYQITPDGYSALTRVTERRKEPS